MKIPLLSLIRLPKKKKIDWYCGCINCYKDRSYNQCLKDIADMNKGEIDLRCIKKVIKHVFQGSCTCNDGNGIVCVGCFYRGELAQAILHYLQTRKEKGDTDAGDKV
jgi:hypothetical protein